MKRIRILIADDHAVFREGLRTLLSIVDDLEVCGEAASGEEAVDLAARLSPDAVLMDLRMPLMDGAEATRRIREALPACKVIALTTFDEDATVFEALRAGAAGYLLKDADVSTIANAVRAAVRGEAVLVPSVAAKVLNEFARLADRAASKRDRPALSEREIEVLVLLANGASNKEIASALFIAEGTVKNHLTNIFAKLHVSDRTQAALAARDLGLV